MKIDFNGEIHHKPRGNRPILITDLIFEAFVAMRHALASLAPLLARVEANERRQILDQAKNEECERKEERREMRLSNKNALSGRQKEILRLSADADNDKLPLIISRDWAKAG